MYLGLTGLAFMVIGPSLIVLNKEIMGEFKFPYPILVSNLGVTMSVVLSRAAAALGYLNPPRNASIEGQNYLRRVMPVGLAHATTLLMGNWVYLYLDMGFIQMLKAFSPVMLLFCQSLMGIGKPASRVVTLSLFTISVGTCVTCTGGIERWSYIGVALMMGSMIFESVRLALTQFLLHDLNFNVLEGLYILSPA